MPWSGSGWKPWLLATFMRIIALTRGRFCQVELSSWGLQGANLASGPAQFSCPGSVRLCEIRMGLTRNPGSMGVLPHLCSGTIQLRLECAECLLNLIVLQVELCRNVDAVPSFLVSVESCRIRETSVSCGRLRRNTELHGTSFLLEEACKGVLKQMKKQKSVWAEKRLTEPIEMIGLRGASIVLGVVGRYRSKQLTTKQPDLNRRNFCSSPLMSAQYRLDCASDFGTGISLSSAK